MKQGRPALPAWVAAGMLLWPFSSTLWAALAARVPPGPAWAVFARVLLADALALWTLFALLPLVWAPGRLTARDAGDLVLRLGVAILAGGAAVAVSAARLAYAALTLHRLGLGDAGAMVGQTPLTDAVAGFVAGSVMLAGTRLIARGAWCEAPRAMFLPGGALLLLMQRWFPVAVLAALPGLTPAAFGVVALLMPVPTLLCAMGATDSGGSARPLVATRRLLLADAALLALMLALRLS